MFSGYTGLLVAMLSGFKFGEESLQIGASVEGADLGVSIVGPSKSDTARSSFIF